MRKIKGFLIFLFAIPVLFLTGTEAFAHNVSTGTPRASWVYLPGIPNSVRGVQAEWNINTTSDGPDTNILNQWSWIALSATDPVLGECHSGETNPQYLRVVRWGGMNWNRFDWLQGATTYEIVAYINNANQVLVSRCT